MILIGHRFIESESLYHILDIDAIKNTPPSSTLYIEFSEDNLDIINYAKLNNIPIALEVHSIEALIYGANFGAKYLVCYPSEAKTFQKLAETYLFDAKILAKIEEDKEIEKIALEGIDGAIYPKGIVKISS